MGLQRDGAATMQSTGDHSSRPTDGEGDALQLTEPGQVIVNIVSREDVPPNGGYGWICAACVFFINAHTWGVNSVKEISCTGRYAY